MSGGQLLYSQPELAPFRKVTGDPFQLPFIFFVIDRYDNQDKLKCCSLRYVVVSNHAIIE